MHRAKTGECPHHVASPHLELLLTHPRVEPCGVRGSEIGNNSHKRDFLAGNRREGPRFTIQNPRSKIRHPPGREGNQAGEHACIQSAPDRGHRRSIEERFQARRASGRGKRAENNQLRIPVGDHSLSRLRIVSVVCAAVTYWRRTQHVFFEYACRLIVSVCLPNGAMRETKRMRHILLQNTQAGAAMLLQYYLFRYACSAKG